MRFQFTKMQGCGNDFLILDMVKDDDPVQVKPASIQYLCDRHFGIGADGFVVLSRSNVASAFWQFFNCDGSPAQMCGNAARCAIRLLAERYYPNEELITIESKFGTIKGKLLDPNGTVEVALFREISPEKASYYEKTIRLGDDAVRVYEIDTGVPHAVIQCDDIRSYPISKIGKALVKHPAFGDEGTNVTFFQPGVGGSVFSTTFERGVEKETFACGTGAAAAALIFSDMYLQPFPVQVVVPGGTLEVDRSPVARRLLLRGPAEYLFNVAVDDLKSEYDQPMLFEGSAGKGVTKK